MAYKIFNPASIDGKYFFQNLSTQRIQHVELIPLTENSPIGRPIRIDDRDELKKFVAMWSGAGTFIANHPTDRWSIEIRFHADKRIYSGVLRGTTNQGVMFDFNESPTKWPVASEYRLATSSTEVEAVLKNIGDSSGM